VLHEADALLVSLGVRHATVELEELARFWPDERDDRDRRSFVYGNLAAIWSRFASRGATQLLLGALIEHRSELRYVAEAVPDTTITVVRLDAPLPVIEERIRRRELDPEDDLVGARWWAEHFEAAQPEDHLVETNGRPVREIATEVLRLGGWIE
jgi:predicted kinase